MKTLSPILAVMAATSAVIALAACQPDAKPVISLTTDVKVTPAAAPAKLCMPPITKDVAFPTSDSKSVLEIIALGDDCRQAVLVTTLRDAAGALIIADGGPAGASTVFAGIDQDGTKPDAALRGFIDIWLRDMSIRTSDAAPDWKEGAARPEEPSGLYIGTEFARDDYLKERAARRPMFCLMSYLSRTTCYVYATEDHQAYRLYDMRS